MGTVNIDISAVNDDPSFTGLPTDVTVTEDVVSNLDLSAVTLADPDASASITMVLTATAGTLTASSGGGVTVSNSGTGAITLAGTAASIDAFLNTASSVQYTSVRDASGNNAATLTITANDGSGVVTLGTVNIDITDVVDTTFITGSGTSNSLFGTAGDDVLSGLAGNDRLEGGDGNDILNGGDDNDFLSGGDGVDTADYSDAGGGVTVKLGKLGGQNTGGSGQDSLTGIENLTGSAFGDRLTGDAGNNVLSDVLGGDDRFIGGAGNDALSVERSSGGATTVFLAGGIGDDGLSFDGNGRFIDYVTLDGQDGADVITLAGAFRANIDAGAGNDTVTADTLGGSWAVKLGGGSDTLALAGTGGSFAASTSNIVRDFATGNGGDVVDLTAYLAGGALTNYTGGDNPFGDGHMRLVQKGSKTLLQVDRDGGGNGYQTVLAFAGTTVGAFTTANFNGIDPTGLTPLLPEGEGKDADAGPQVWVQETHDKALMPEVLPGPGDEARDGFGDPAPLTGVFGGGSDTWTPLTVDEAGDGFVTVTGGFDRAEAEPLVLPGEPVDDPPEPADPFTWTQADNAGPSALTVAEDGSLLAGSGSGDQGRDGWLF